LSLFRHFYLAALAELRYTCTIGISHAALGNIAYLGENWWQTMYIRQGISPLATVVSDLAQSKIIYVNISIRFPYLTDNVVRAHSHRSYLVLFFRG